jgi:hypothetical protein
MAAKLDFKASRSTRATVLRIIEQGSMPNAQCSTSTNENEFLVEHWALRIEHCALMGGYAP